MKTLRQNTVTLLSDLQTPVGIYLKVRDLYPLSALLESSDYRASQNAVSYIGGDGKNTFNISTAACFVVAGTGRKVVKHGNYGSSSISGASNVLENHGVKFTSDISRLRRSLDVCGMSYLHAPFFNPALKAVAPVRKQLGVRNFFNMLGPLVNPTMPRYQLLGVYSLKLMRLYGYIAQKEGIKCTVVHSLDGYDEISLTAPFKVMSPEGDSIMTPSCLGMPTAAPAALGGGGTVAETSAIFDRVLRGDDRGDRENCVVANAAFAIRTLSPQVSTADAVAEARESIRSGRAFDVLKKFVESNS